MTHKAHRVVAMIVGQDENNVARLGFRHALYGQLVVSNRLAKRSQANYSGKKYSDVFHGKKETAATPQFSRGVWLRRSAL
jgi:hypothetical protein